MTTREVLLDGGSPWGFRMHGGVDVQQQLKIYRVNPGSKAANQGIREGDVITSINGQSTRDKTNTEAHALLKHAGDNLRLGLNEDCSGSPKKRQYRTVQQETHSETVKRSNISSSTYSLSTTKSQTQIETNIDKSAKTNSDKRVNGDSKLHQGQDCLSEKSTISSNYSSAASTPLTLTDTQGVDKVESSAYIDHDDAASQTDSVTMADAANGNSRSRRRRRNVKKKPIKRPVVSTNVVTVQDDQFEQCEVLTSEVAVTETEMTRVCDATKPKELKSEQIEHYRVESPKTVPNKDKSKKKTGTMVKSKSLDDDETLRIQELSSGSETEDKNECSALIFEADSDVDWEITEDLIVKQADKQVVHTMDIDSLELEECTSSELKLISPEDESNLRCFLEGLNLVTSPEESAKHAHEKQSAENIRAKRAQKREELAQYFLPVYQNPRLLDAISEESSDLSDKEQKENKSKIIDIKTRKSRLAKQTTPNLISEKAILLDTEIIATPIISDTCTTSIAETSSGVEVVYLEDDDSDDYADAEDEADEINDTPSSQITPPPTPDSASPVNGLNSDSDELSSFVEICTQILSAGSQEKANELFKDIRFKYLPNDLQQKFCTITKQADIQSLDDIPKPIQREYALSPSVPSRSPSFDGEDSSSRGTSLCTTIWKGDFNFQPLSLRELCLGTLMSLPFGREVLEELADVSKSLGELTNNINASVATHKLPAFVPGNTSVLTNNHADANTSFDLPVKTSENKMKNDEKWVGMPTEEDPQVVLCLSPTQKSHLETTKKVPHEADKLLDLHTKYLERRSYHSDVSALQKESNPGDSRGVNGDMSNRLLAIIRESAPGKPSAESECAEDDMYLYYVDKDTRNRSHSVTLPRTTIGNKNKDSARLHARNLSEWLQLARDKSGNEVQLNFKHSIKEKNVAAVNTTRNNEISKRRLSLPQEIYVQQMQYLIQKEKEIQQELEKLEEEKRKLTSEMTPSQQFDPSKYHISKNEDIAIHNDELNSEKKFKLKSTPQSEVFRQQMYDEYMRQVAERQERKQLKVIKISSHQDLLPSDSKDKGYDKVIHVKGIEDEFMNEVKQRKCRYSQSIEDSGDGSSFDKSDVEESEPVLVMDGISVSDTKKLPKHLKEFVDITRQAADAIHENEDEDGGWSRKTKEAQRISRVLSRNRHRDHISLLQEIDSSLNLARGFLLCRGIWSPGQRESFSSEDLNRQPSQEIEKGDESLAPVWIPKSAGSSPQLERKEFRPVTFSSPVLGRKNNFIALSDTVEPPWKNPGSSSDVGFALSSSLQKRIPNSHSAPPSGFEFSTTPRLPRAQNPTITLLQKAREGQLPKGASYIEEPPPVPRKREAPPKITPGEIVYEIRNEYTSESDTEKPRRMADLGQRKFIGIGPTTRDGMPLTLRSEVRDQNQSKWYKKMYDTIHKQKPRYDDDYITLRYRQRRGRYPYNSGYVSEPEPGAYYDSDASNYESRITTLDRRRPPASASDTFTATYTMPRSSTNSHVPQSDVIKHGKDVYKNQPGRIENYIPGHSSISDKEAKEWWDEVMDIFDGWLDDHSAQPSYNYMLSRAVTRNHLEQQKHIPSKGYMSHALKESGYESDSTLVFRRRDDAANQLSPLEQREAYKTIQKGGDVPLHGLRKPAPERPKDSGEIEYIPISPTLTRIRVHKGSPSRNEVLMYPVNVRTHENVFANYKRTAPSSIPKPPPMPPSPPKRRSSRNNSTLRLISTMRVRSDKTSSGKRHETCFTSSSNVKKSNVKYLRDKITCKLSPVPKKKGESRLKVTKTISASPELRSKLSSTLTTSKDPKTSTSKVYSKTNISTDSLTRASSVTSLRKPCRSCSSSPVKKGMPKSDILKTRTTSLDRTFGVEKKKIDSVLTKSSSEKRLVKSPELISPTEVKKAAHQASKIIQKQTKPTLASIRNGSKSPSKMHDIPIKVSISEKGRQLLVRSSSPSTSRLKLRNECLSPSPSTSSDKSKISRSSASMESLKPSSKRGKPVSKTKSSHTASLPKENVVLRKSKKDQLNDEIAKKKLSKQKVIKCAGKAAGSEIAKQLKNIENGQDPLPITLEDIKQQKANVETDSFFQHLFLRDVPIQKSSTYSTTSWITEKTRAMERRRTSVSEPSIGALKIYLKHTKPVSDSKFKAMDALIVRSRSASPKFVRWEDDKFKRTSSERSASLPPKLMFTETSRPVSPLIQKKRLDTNLSRTTIIRPLSPAKLVFTETTRPVSPIIQHKRPLNEKEIKEQRRRSPERLFFTETVRPISPLSHRKYPVKVENISKVSRTSKSPEKLIFTQTSRPVSPVIRSRSSSPKFLQSKDRRRSRSNTPETLYFSQTSRPASPMYSSAQSIQAPETILRSPSYRRIQSLHGDTVEYLRRKIPRSRSASEADEKHYDISEFGPPSLAQSTWSIDSCDRKEYQMYVKELVHSTRKSERFKELNKFYSTIERLGELERTTSSADLRPRRRHEDEIIDYDRWKEVRQRERAESEMNAIYKELKDVQREKDLLFLPKDFQNYKWKKDFDRGLRIKEKSVENIKDDFERLRIEEQEEDKQKMLDLQYKKDIYKPLWRGNSVVNLAQAMVEKRSHSEGRAKTLKQKKLESERLLTHGIGSRIWSSLSMEQVNILKNQLEEIYQNDTKNHHSPKHEYIVEVPENTKPVSTTLSVRRNSDSSKSIHQRTNGSRLQSSKTKLENKEDILSEIDKKRLSQSLSQEILERQRQRYKNSVSLVLGKETRGAVAAADANIKPLSELPSPRTCYSLEMSEDGEKDKKNKDSDFLLVLAKDDQTHKTNINETLTEWAQPKKPLVKTDAVNLLKNSSTSETESTDESTKTVLYVDTKDVKKKVRYFEHVLEKDDYTPTVYKPAETVSDIEEKVESCPKTSPKLSEKPSQKLSPKTSPIMFPKASPKSNECALSKKLKPSRSYQDLKELFGENESAKLSSPISRPASSNSTRTPLLRSTENVYRTRSLSPNPELYYFSLIKAGDVRKLTNKFDGPRRCNSDSQINRKGQIVIPGQRNGEVDNLRRKYEYPFLAGRGRSRIRRGGVVSPLFLKAEDRYMPHINIISKIASLYPRKSTTKEIQKSTEELAEILGIPVGEVEKLRQKFDSSERMSLLGHMFTSSPNLNELRDIAPYLAGPWTAHRYPRREDNTRSLSSPDDATSSMDTSLVLKSRTRPKSTSPPRPKVKLSSILKPESPKEAAKVTKTEYDPTIHRPKSRYQPPVARAEPVRYRSWWSPTHNKPTVTFKEPEVPLPPPKGPPRKPEDPESPRKYVENEVTIHYRTPVRQEVKEALSEDELQRRQAEHMKKVYQEERRRKYLQVSQSLDCALDELQDMNSRRHTDNFIQSQKSPIPLNRYDDFLDDYSPKLKPRPRSPEPRLVAKASFNFVGQSARELTFRKGDIIYIRRQIDKNWYEGEHNAMVGLFPANYVEIVPYDGIKSTTRKPHEGQARAKYNFIAQTHLELSLAKGELVVITRKVDDNWFEGKIGGRKGIFPTSYVEVLIDPSDPPAVPQQSKPVATPAAHSLLVNGSLGGKESMGSHNYVPPLQNSDTAPSYHAKPVQITGNGTYGSLSRTRNPLNQELHVDTQSEPYVPYRALYKYKPQNEDEIELLEGDTVYVLEKCDDGWFVGASERTGALGTFPGNYVERI